MLKEKFLLDGKIYQHIDIGNAVCMLLVHTLQNYCLIAHSIFLKVSIRSSIYIHSSVPVHVDFEAVIGY